MAKKVLILLGTRKGAFIVESDAARQSWSLRGPFCETWPMNHVMADPATGTIYGGGGNEWFGPAVWKSTDLGATWTHSSEGLAYAGGRAADQGGVEPRAGNGSALYAGVAAGRPVRERRRGPVLAACRRLAESPDAAGLATRRRRADPAFAARASRRRQEDLGRDLRRRRVPHRRWRRDLGAAQPGHAGRLPAGGPELSRSSASACIAS